MRKGTPIKFLLPPMRYTTGTALHRQSSTTTEPSHLLTSEPTVETVAPRREISIKDTAINQSVEKTHLSFKPTNKTTRTYRMVRERRVKTKKKNFLEREETKNKKKNLPFACFVLVSHITTLKEQKKRPNPEGGRHSIEKRLMIASVLPPLTVRDTTAVTVKDGVYSFPFFLAEPLRPVSGAGPHVRSVRSATPALRPSILNFSSGDV